jgi:chromate reductase
MAELNVRGICGSLRKGSFNRAVLDAAIEVAPPGIRVEPLEWGDLPIYNADDDGDRTPASVQRFKDAIRAADAVLIVSPEYNYSIPGGLKNAIDWASREKQGTPQCFADKPVAILGASPGNLGTARMQYHLRQVFVFLDAKVLNKPELMIGQVATKVDPSGRLTDETTRGLLNQQLDALAAWSYRLKSQT